MIDHLDHLVLTTSHEAECIRFYTEVLGMRHLLAEAVEGPRPRGGDAAVVEVPAAAAGAPDRRLRGLDARRVEGCGRRLARRDLAALAAAELLDELEDVGELQLGDLDQREVPDRSVRAVQHEEIREAGDRDREVRGRTLLPHVVEGGEIVERGHLYIAQPPLYQIARKKRVEYVEDDAQLNRILIQLGTEEVRLRSVQDDKELSEKQLSEILELLEALDKFANGLRRKGGATKE